MNIGFVNATQADIQPIFEQCKSLIDAYEDITSIDYDKVLAWLKRKIQTNISKYTVIMLGEEKAGYYCLDRQGDKWELDDFYILPAFRSRGIGTAALKAICNSADGCIFLYVFSKNMGAVSLYKRFGFETVEVVSDTRQIMERPG